MEQKENNCLQEENMSPLDRALYKLDLCIQLAETGKEKLISLQLSSEEWLELADFLDEQEALAVYANDISTINYIINAPPSEYLS